MAALALARELVRQGHEVDYVTTHYRGLPAVSDDGGVRIFREKVWGRTTLQTASMRSLLSFPLAAIRRGSRLGRQRPYDVLNTHFAIPSGLVGVVLSRYLGLPHVLTVLGADVYDPTRGASPHRNPVLKQVVTSVLNRADVIVPESRDLADKTASIYAPRSEIRIVPLGLALPAPGRARPRSELGLADGKLYALAIGRLVRRKGTHDLLSALARVPLQVLELLIVGDGPEAPALKRQAAELGIAERVHFWGQVDEATKYQLLMAADLFALASVHEGFGIVYLEAMYCGLPIATTYGGGQTDFLAEGRNALLSAPGDPEGLARSLTLLLTDATRRREMGARNREDVKGHLIEGVARQYAELFETARRTDTAVRE